MALWSVKELSETGKALILAPERYDPRRESLGKLTTGITIGNFVQPLRKLINPHSGGSSGELFLVLDTSDANEGLVVGRKTPVAAEEIGSTKKLAPTGSVIISRLRPYLRQVAYVDEGIDGLGEGIFIACSTEYFVLTARDNRAIAFLVPFLLTEEVQRVLAASQEGGHHPRFDEGTLLSLPVPKSWFDRRDELSEEVELAIKSIRQARRVMVKLTESSQSGLIEKQHKIRSLDGITR